MKKRILFVDDEASIVDYHKQLLEGRGYEVVVAYDGTEAFEIVQREPVDLLITDCQMRSMHGSELSIKSKQLKPDLPIIMASLYQPQPHCADRILEKPYQLESLLREINFWFD